MTIAKFSSRLIPKVHTFVAAVEEFEARLKGQLIRPSDAAYEEARRLWNGRIDKYPAFIVRCLTAQDVILAVNFAREHNLMVAVRGGAHNSNGFATVDSGLVIDLSQMKGIVVDPTARIARAEPGLTFGELSRALQTHGLMTTTGICAGTGISGATLGAGTGWLMGKYGLAIDNVLSVELVTAGGQLLKANATENPDLFWGIRGGGGNFGVVTAIEYQLHPLGQVLAGMAIYPLAKAKEVMRFYRDFSAAAPDEVTLYAILATVPDVGPAAIIMGGYFGDDLAEGERLLAPLRQFGPPLLNLIQPMAYPDLLDLINPLAPDGRNYFQPGHSIKAFSDEALDTLIGWAEKFTSPYSALIIHHVHGAAARVPSDATAFALREPHYIILHDAVWEEGPAEPHIAWAEGSFAAMRPYANRGVYVNFIIGEGEQAVRDSYRANYDRLTALKHKYDPTNFFRRNQNIKPVAPKGT